MRTRRSAEGVRQSKSNRPPGTSHATDSDLPAERPAEAAPGSPVENDRATHADAAPQLEPAAAEDADEARRRRIAERAYLRAERRGFAPGQELDDWLAAESEEARAPQRESGQ
jgi:Protein of unknown function (DUF2934)